MATHKTVFVTERPPVHQATAIEAAPETLDITMLASPSRAEIVAALTDAEFLVSERSGRIDAEMIRSAPDLKLIQRLGTRSHDIDLAAAKDAGVVVCCQPLEQSIAVAEQTIGVGTCAGETIA